MSSEAPLDYEQLYAEYNSGLVDKLRGFGPAQEYLSLWVPDEDLLTSLRNMLDAAASAQCPRLAVRLGAASIAQLDAGRLQRLCEHFGKVSLQQQPDHWLVEVRDLREGSAPVEVSLPGSKQRPTGRVPSADVATPTARDVYADALERAASDIQYEGLRPVRDGLLEVTAEHDGVLLQLGVHEQSDHRIEHARFGNASGQHVALLDQFCRILMGHSVQEASDHAAARLELGLRSRRDERPVPGIVLPGAAHPMFALPIALVRTALAQYREAAGYRAVHNFHDDRPAERWLQAEDAQRRSWLSEALDAAAEELGYDRGDAQVHEIQYDVRVVLTVGGRIAGEHKPRQLLRIEHALRDRVDPRLEVFVEELKDRNKLRRLAVVGG